MERRHFLQLAFLGLIEPLLFQNLGCASAARSGSDRIGDKGSVFLLMSGPDHAVVRKMDWNTGHFDDYSIPLKAPHSLLEDRVDSNVVYVFEAIGSAVRLDLSDGEVTKIDHREKGEIFFGHAIQSEDGEHLFCTVLNPALSRAVISVKDSRSLRTIDQLPSDCDGSHQIALLPKTSIAACAVSSALGMAKRKGGAITFFDLSKSTVLNRVELEHQMSHVFPISPDEVIGLGMELREPASLSHGGHGAIDLSGNFSAENMRPIPLYSVKKDGTIREFWDVDKKDLFKFNFAAAQSPDSRTLLTTHRGSGQLIAWRDQSIFKVIPVPVPGNIVISRDGSEFMVAADRTAKVFSMETLTETRTIRSERGIAAIYLSNKTT